MIRTAKKKRKEIYLITEIKKVDLFFKYDRDWHIKFDNMVLRKVANGTLGKILVFLLVKNIWHFSTKFF